MTIHNAVHTERSWLDFFNYPDKHYYKSTYNIVLGKRAFSLANTLDPFAHGLDDDVSICTFFSAILFIDVDTL